jgi:GGDEF domain-containing protein
MTYGDYFQHVLSFWSHRFDDNFTFLVYEHMKNNPKEAVLKIAQFLGEEFVVKLKENNEFLLNKILENSTIDAMKSKTEFDVLKLVRKGVVGDWRNHFTKAQSDLVDDRVRQLWTGTGLENLWAEEMKW